MSILRSASCFVTHQGDPYYNMAFDEWLLMCALRDPQFVAFRLYTWQPGAITIGLNQRAETALDWKEITDTPVIRRVTGGRALYHDPSELTYSLVMGTEAVNQLMPELQTQRISGQIATALSQFLGQMGIGAEFVRRSSPLDLRPVAHHAAPCFASSARYELVSEGRKIVASAQRRIGTSVLQHGSIKITGVAFHPALRGVGGGQQGGKVWQAVETEYLAASSAKFFTALGESFKLALSSAAEASEQTVLAQASEIRSAPLGRREFF